MKSNLFKMDAVEYFHNGDVSHLVKRLPGLYAPHVC